MAKPVKSLLNKAWTRVLDGIIVPLLPRRRANLLQCSKKGLWDDYFPAAETVMQRQWEEIIWPLIKDFDFDTVLELAPGGGRNTERLCEVAGKIYAVDYNSYALQRCREKLGSSHHGCEIEYYVNNGTDLRVIDDSSVSAVYCWDAAVHFEKSIMNSYVKEFFRVLRPGGRGFVHHSALGDKAHKNIKKNPHWRSNVSRESFARMCRASGLRIMTQADIPWNSIVDCGTVFEKN